MPNIVYFQMLFHGLYCTLGLWLVTASDFADNIFKNILFDKIVLDL